MNLRPLLVAGLIAAIGSHGALASDLGTAGPFRSLGGTSCPQGATDGCAPPPVDAALPKPQQVRAHVARALALLDLLQVSGAQADLDEAIRLDPADVQALTLRGRLAMNNAEPAKAVVDIDHALSLVPDNPNLLATRGALAFSLCRCDQAAKDLDAAIRADPNNVDALFLRAQYYLGIHDPTRAFIDLSTSLSVAPNDARARLMRAKTQLMRKNYDLATLDADKVIASEPGSIDALMTRATARRLSGDDAGAIESLTALLDGPAHAANSLFIPDLREAMLQRARLLMKANRPAEATRDLDAIVAQGGQRGILRLQLYLRANGFPNVEVTGERSSAFDTALGACFSTATCGPDLLR